MKNFEFLLQAVGIKKGRVFFCFISVLAAFAACHWSLSLPSIVDSLFHVWSLLLFSSVRPFRSLIVLFSPVTNKLIFLF